MGLNYERQKLFEKLEEVEAFLFLTFQLVPTNKIRIGIIKRDLPNLNKGEIKNKFERLDQFIQDPKKQYGLKVNRAELVKLYKERIPQGRAKNEIFYSGKWELEYYFRNPKEFFGEIWDFLPSHALVGYLLDQASERRFVWYLPEAQTYMDMCACINTLVSISNQKEISVVDQRKMHSDIKNAIMQSYIFLEAYLNGIALDYFFDTKESANDEEKEIIFEWDFIRKRRKYLSTRDKLLRYFKLITGKACPLSENNCSEMKFIFKDLEDFRDSIVHPNIMSFTGTTYDINKMAGHLRHPMEFALQASDNVIKLIRRIDKLILKDKADRLSWLYDRNDKGVFPKEAFL